ncbi:YcxB family protein [Streptomyces sp. 4F14]|uniref:YcxB family protein n=1 Tax=Streptomyces sp. 4F14 TaxID=3394380 RepID=UPI003A86221C
MTGEQVVLEYETRRADYAEMYRLQLRKRPLGLIFRWPFVIAFGLLGAAMVVLRLLTGGGLDPLGLLIVVYAGLLRCYPALAAARLQKANAHQGTVRTTVGAEGIRKVTARAETRTEWSNYGSYAESDAVFIVRSPDRGGRCVSFLPKRGAGDPADVERLRELLDANLRRV